MRKSNKFKEEWRNVQQGTDKNIKRDKEGKNEQRLKMKKSREGVTGKSKEINRKKCQKRKEGIEKSSKTKESKTKQKQQKKQ